MPVLGVKQAHSLLTAEAGGGEHRHHDWVGGVDTECLQLVPALLWCRLGQAAELVSDPVFLGFGQADPQVEAERLGDLPGEELTDGLACDPVNDLAEEVAERQRVVGEGGARLP